MEVQVAWGNTNYHYVSVPEKTDHSAQISDVEVMDHVVTCYSLYATVKSESR